LQTAYYCSEREQL